VPELPEVEVARRNLARWARGRKVRGAEADATRMVSGPRWEGGPPLAAVVGARVEAIDRVGKNLLLTLARGRSERVGLWSHLGMTGKWLRRPAGAPAPRFSHARLALEGGAVLHYCDMRRFGRIQIVPGARFDEVPRLAELGPDPLRDGVDAAKLHARLARVRLPIKVALLDQTVLAGVGNIQSTEACFRARIDPRRAASSLTRAEIGRLGRAILASIDYTLDEFSASGAGSGDGDIVYVEENRAANPFKVYGRAGEPCPRRNGTIKRIVQAGRSTFFCEACLAPR
jgi:formamidopyrimidine-DNA glycosylase